MYQYELELDREFESELESEYESEQFLGGLLRRIAPVAVRAVGSLLNGNEEEFESSYEDEKDPFLGTIAQALGEGEYELEFEDEATQTAEYEALMEHLAYSAAQTESEAEAEAFLGALIPLAARALPLVAKAATKIVPKVAPTLIKGVSKLGQTLFRSPSTRPLIKALPHVVKGTVRSLAGQAAAGKPLTQQAVIRTLGRATHQALSNPKTTAKVMRRSRTIHAHKCPQCARKGRLG